jgi:hypothetical protein
MRGRIRVCADETTGNGPESMGVEDFTCAGGDASRGCGSGGADHPCRAGRERRPADALRSRAMVNDGLRLVCRREVDLVRVTSAACS